MGDKVTVGRIEQLTTTPAPEKQLYIHTECPECARLRAQLAEVQESRDAAQFALDGVMRQLAESCQDCGGRPMSETPWLGCRNAAHRQADSLRRVTKTGKVKR